MLSGIIHVPWQKAHLAAVAYCNEFEQIKAKYRAWHLKAQLATFRLKSRDHCADVPRCVRSGISIICNVLCHLQAAGLRTT